MRSGDRTIGVARALAVLLPAALLLHETVYLLGPAAAPGPHGYLATAAPFAAAAAVLLALLTLCAPALGAGRSAAPPGRLPLLLAGVLAATFATQELVEVTLLGGGAEAAAAALAAGWALPPLALGFGAACAALFVRLGDAAEAIARRLAVRRRGPRRRPVSLPRPPAAMRTPPRPLAFGLARRPPPLPA
jgi:hypothetical protein